MTDADTVWDTAEDGTVTITLKPKGGHEVPWIVLRYPTVATALAAFKKDEGADLMDLFQNVAGAQKAFDKVFNNQPLPPPRTQGKPEGADRPSPQVTTNADPFEKPDDAPPFEVPDPTCKHGAMTRVEHGGKVGFVCQKPKGDAERCDTVFP